MSDFHTDTALEMKDLYVGYYKDLKDLSVFRRYAAKFISEYEMFSNGDLSDGRPYADTMARITGFYHQPESHLFDLVPEFYCADYLLGWMGEAALADNLSQRFGRDALLLPEAGNWLQSLWHQGNRLDIFSFFNQNGLGPLTAAGVQSAGGWGSCCQRLSKGSAVSGDLWVQHRVWGMPDNGSHAMRSMGPADNMEISVWATGSLIRRIHFFPARRKGDPLC